MTWMNEYEIDQALHRYRDHPVLGPATRTLSNLRDATNRNSDGWPYWQKPANAAAKLMTLIQGSRDDRWDDPDREKVTLTMYKATLGPIKAFRTRSKLDFVIDDGSVVVPADAGEFAAAAALVREALALLNEAKTELAPYDPTVTICVDNRARSFTRISSAIETLAPITNVAAILARQ